MRVYLFDTETGLFSGEDYCDPKYVKEENGITNVPPPNRETGTVPVFDRTAGAWKLIPNEVIRGKKDA